MRVLVTGGQGFIGSYVREELAEHGHEAVLLDRRNYPSDWPCILGDVRDSTAVSEAVGDADGVIHLAGVLGTQETIADPRPAAEVNVLGGLNVLQACARHDVPLVNIAVGNWFEDNAYSITKSAVERLARMNAVHAGRRQASVRALNAYGPRQSVAAPHGSSKVRKIMPSFISRALHGEPIEVYGDGRQVMDMIWAGDVARVLVAALGWVAGPAFDPQAPAPEAGSGKATTVLEVAQVVQAEVQRQAGIWAPVEHLPLRPGETPGVEVRADVATLKPLGISAESFKPLREGAAATVGYYMLRFGVRA